MANYSYQSSSYSSNSGGNPDAAFSQADSNQDGRVDLGEFRNFLGNNLGAAGAGYGSSAAYETSYGGAAGLGAGSSVYESSSYSSGAGLGAGLGVVNAGLGSGSSVYESSSYSSGAGYGGDVVLGAGAGAFDSSAVTTQVQQQTYATDAQGLFQDSNPQIIRRAAISGPQTYVQNIRVRFLQPPPVPPHGPLIIREVRPPQPAPPPPLRIRQQAPPLPQPPPLVLRERPPVAPQVIAGQTVIRRLAAIPVPPRSVIIERLPPLPPRPRDIIIERWVPYAAQAKRRTIVQRAGAAVQYPAPRNVIVQYEPVQVRIVRQFQRFGVTQANPAAYVQQYGAQLLDASSLVQQARAAGVVEDISAPAVAAAFSSVGYGAGAYGQEVVVGGGLGAAQAYEASSYSSGGLGDVALAGAGVGLGGTSTYESSSYTTSGGLGAAGLVGAVGSDAAFASADLNQDGSLDRGEFANFAAQNLGGGSTYQSESYSSSASY